MGQKVNPYSLRLKINRTWKSQWFASKRKYTEFLGKDLKLRKLIEKDCKDSGVSSIEILRDANKTTVNIYSGKPGMIIGRQGEGIEKLRAKTEKMFNEKIVINVHEIRKPDLDARIVAENIASQISRRISYRRAAKMSVGRAMENGAKGIKILCSGRLNGVEIARDETFAEGKIPLHTFRADIDYACLPAFTTYGAIGVKVWIYRGEIFNNVMDKRRSLPSLEQARSA